MIKVKYTYRKMQSQGKGTHDKTLWLSMSQFANICKYFPHFTNDLGFPQLKVHPYVAQGCPPFHRLAFNCHKQQLELLAQLMGMCSVFSPIRASFHYIPPPLF